MKTQDIPKAFRTLPEGRTISALITPRLQKLKPSVVPLAPTYCTGVVFTPVGMWIAKPNTSLFSWRLESLGLTPFMNDATDLREVGSPFRLQFMLRAKEPKSTRYKHFNSSKTRRFIDTQISLKRPSRRFARGSCSWRWGTGRTSRSQWRLPKIRTQDASACFLTRQPASASKHPSFTTRF